MEKKSAQTRKPRSKSHLDKKTRRGKIVPRTKKRFWTLGVLAAVLFGQSFAILSQGPFISIWFLSYEQAVLLGVLEMLVVLVLTVVFLWKTVVWWHDRPRSLKHVFDDPHIIS
jgi:hypothetical protein